MNKQDINYVTSLLLLTLLIFTAVTGYIQAQLELRKFVPHRCFAYATLCLVLVHVCLNANKVIRYIRHKTKM